jgi:hypothetical protein
MNARNWMAMKPRRADRPVPARALASILGLVPLLGLAGLAYADGPGLVSALRSDGAGGFTVTQSSPWSDYALPNGNWLSADLNGDGRLDMVHAVNNSDYVHTWISNGDGTYAVGTFRPWAGYAIPNGVWLTADINGDGKTDIVHAVANSDYVHTWISNGNGTFNVGTFRPWAGYAIPNGVWLTADINGDGKADIVHAVANTDYVHTWMSNGNGTFNVGTFRPWAGYGIPNGNWMTADLNGDGKADIVHAVANTDYVHTWMSNGNGSFNVGTFRPWAGYGIPNGVWMTSDLNGDGKTDLFHAVANSDYAHTWMSNGNGSFNVGTFRPWAGYAIPNGKWMTADINGDGKTDIVHAVANSDYLHTWQSSGNGSFAVGTFRPWSGYRVGDGQWLSQDFSGDHRSDLVHVYPVVPARGLEVRRFTTAVLNNADADRILTDATRVLVRNDGTGDVACPVRLFRQGNVSAFNNGNGMINSNADFNTINGLAGRVKVVNQINWCGGLIPNVIGCAPVPGNSQVVVRFTANQEGILWAHEYGHTRNLGHVTGATSIMNGTIGTTHTRVTQNECNSMDN